MEWYIRITTIKFTLGFSYGDYFSQVYIQLYV